jgi:hypothetical protein
MIDFTLVSRPRFAAASSDPEPARSSRARQKPLIASRIMRTDSGIGQGERT